ncbi:MAG: hypothetical protein DMG65_02205 [Candidatus Angelobacter sp. Gp1-AA117]|nr:MAG: hypothetical protein DMG65_02205 [Candidatus Angelobacter sp. Gp1-AA117]
MANTSLRQLADFPETRDKIVENIEVFSDHEYYGITIRFTDKTALAFALETAVFAFPVLSDWADGNETILKKYKSIRSHIQRS